MQESHGSPIRGVTDDCLLLSATLPTKLLMLDFIDVTRLEMKEGPKRESIS